VREDAPVVGRLPASSAPTPVAPGRLFGLTEIAAMLGMGGGRVGGQRLRRYLVRRQGILGVQILVAIGSAERAVFRVSLATLREHCPELFDSRREMEEMLRERLEQIEEQVVRLGKNDARIADTLTTLGAQLNPRGARVR